MILPPALFVKRAGKIFCRPCQHRKKQYDISAQKRSSALGTFFPSLRQTPQDPIEGLFSTIMKRSLLTMKRRIFTAVLAAAMVLSLAACGGKNGGASSSDPGGSSGGGSSSSQPDGSDPSGSGSAGGSASSSDGSQPDGSAGDIEPLPSATLTLNRTNITLNKAGATFQLKWTVDPVVNTVPTFTSSDGSVVKVDSQGKITAVAPGKATITVEQSSITDASGKPLSATCNVTCDWKTETDPTPDTSKPNGDSSSGGSSSGSSSSGGSSSGDSSSAPAANVDLSDFYTTVTGKYEFGFLELADSSILDNVYPGLSGISAEQMLVYVCMISMNNGEFGLVQVKDSKDVDAVKAAFQSRIDYMVGDGNGPGGAQYPMAMDQWENNSRIVSNGNYVMMIVHENCDDIVNEFNALF